MKDTTAHKLVTDLMALAWVLLGGTVAILLMSALHGC